ncbi:MAG: hypothetical protein EP334_03055 [Gammaproteobacteria bacterium]|nr:MAG: hypothetical protein EP334_03055 [Gammaproteobacteria bacterium]
MQKVQAYLVGALLMFGSATWAALFAQNVTAVIALMAIPCLLCGYVYATALPQYVWGMLLGLCVYMMAEFAIYGPVYQVTGLIYAIGFAISLGCTFCGYALYRWKARHQQNRVKKTGKHAASKAQTPKCA